MYVPARSQRDEYKRIILRTADAIRKWTSENLDSTENRRFELTNEGLVLKVFIRSIRAKELLQRLQREVLTSGFARTIPWLEDSGEWSIWFGFSEPVESPNYVRINPSWNFPQAPTVKHER
jgi:hypothetical protein